MASAAVLAPSAMRGQGPDQAKLSRIGVMSLVFNSVLKDPSTPDDPKRTLAIMDFPDMLAERYGIHVVEMQHEHFLSTEPAYFQEFLGRVKKAKSMLSQINLEFGPLNVSATNPVRLLETIDLTKRWIDHAATMGCPRVMVNQGTLDPAVRKSEIEALKTINAYAKTKKVAITIEPRRALWEAAFEVIQASGIKAHPDCGMFPDDAARAKGLRLMYPMTAGNSHVYFGSNIADSVKIAKEVGYKGLYTMEGSRGEDPYARVQTMRDILLANI
jgi:sugar phosphate isomerase/epimerase